VSACAFMVSDYAKKKLGGTIFFYVRILRPMFEGSRRFEKPGKYSTTS